MTLRNVAVASVEVAERRRQLDFGKVQELAKSIREVGVLTPITITPTNRLVAGNHRLEACRIIGLRDIPANVVELSDLQLELAEIDENLVRNELTVLERSEHLARRQEIYEALHPETKAGTKGALTKHHGKAATETISFADATAQAIGSSPRTVQHETQIAKRLAPDVKERLRETEIADNKTELLRLARLPADEQRQVVDKLEAGASNVRTAKNLTVADAIRKEPAPLPAGPFRVIVIDPPWRYEKRAEDATHRAGLPYPDMSTGEIVAMPIEKLAHDDAILWLWTTNAFMEDAYLCLKSWGFEAKTILTWAKDRMGTGDWLRGKTEHCILAVRGRPTVTLTNQTTLLEAPLREHSRKPEEFYELVEALCPGSKCEVFARETRDGWTSHGAESTKFDGGTK
ncbi:MAG TPA: MT-A70 family methyltransferase [Phycisphaerales bacterium]|nr:MT-A70 family methyltransferase [Phycisphaerales bacterium]